MLKKLVVTLLITLFAVQTASADCLDAYHTEFVQREAKHKKWRTIGRATTGTVGALSGGFWTYMGIALVGAPAGIVIGLGYALAAAIPVGLPFFGYNLFKKRRMQDYHAIYQALGEDTDKFSKRTKKVLQKMVKKMEMEQREDLINHLKSLSLSEALCDGTVTGDVEKPLARPKHIWKYHNQ